MRARLLTAAAAAVLLSGCGSAASHSAGGPPAPAPAYPTASPTITLKQFGDLRPYCAAVPRAQAYVRTIASVGLMTANGSAVAGTFDRVIAAAPKVIKDDWTLVRDAEVATVDGFAALHLSAADRVALGHGGAGLSPAGRAAVQRYGQAVVSRIATDQRLGTAVTNVVDATHFLCHMDLVPQPGDDPSAYAVPSVAP